MTDAAKSFPLSPGSRSDKIEPGPLRIPWAIAEEAYAVYAKRYGRDQSLKTLADRGGFGWGEMDEFLPGWRDRVDLVTQLNAHILNLEISRGEMAEGVLAIAKAIGVTEDDFDDVIDLAGKAGKVNAELERVKKLAFDAQADAGLQRSERDKWKHAADIERVRVEALEADITEGEAPPCLHDETKFCRLQREKDYWMRTAATNLSAVEEAHEREDETKARLAQRDDELEKWPDDVAEALGDDYHGRDGEDVLTATRRIVSGLRARVAELEEASVEIVIPPGATNPCPDCRGFGEVVFIEAGMTGPVSRSHRTETCKTCDGLGVIPVDGPRVCLNCDGIGRVATPLEEPNDGLLEKPCPCCNGTGAIPPEGSRP